MRFEREVKIFEVKTAASKLDVLCRRIFEMNIQIKKLVLFNLNFDRIEHSSYANMK